MFKVYTLVLLAVVLNSASSANAQEEFDCGSGLKYPFGRACEKDLKCPNNADMAECPSEKLKVLICDSKIIPVTMHELCEKNVPCSNKLNEFVCESTRIWKKKEDNNFWRDAPHLKWIQLTRYDLCYNYDDENLIAACKGKLATQLTTVFKYPDDPWDFMLYWHIRDLDEFQNKGVEQFNSAFTQRLKVQHGNVSVTHHTLSHPNHWVWFLAKIPINYFDAAQCPLKSKEIICNALPHLWRKLQEKPSSSGQFYTTSLNLLFLLLGSSLYFTKISLT